MEIYELYEKVNDYRKHYGLDPYVFDEEKLKKLKLNQNIKIEEVRPGKEYFTVLIRLNEEDFNTELLTFHDDFVSVIYWDEQITDEEQTKKINYGNSDYFTEGTVSNNV